MSKIAFLFPGQASQYIGMAADLFEKSSIAKECFEKAKTILDFDIKSICFEGPESELKQTRITQPAIFLHSYILTQLLGNLKPDMVAGHSLGEYSAVVYSGSLSFEDGLKLVALRGSLMQQAGDENEGTMAAIIGLAIEKVESACLKAKEYGVVQLANFNSPDQIVISGSSPAVKKAMEFSKALGAKLVKELVVSGAFHSPLMRSAGEALGKALENINFKNSDTPIYSNVTALPSNRATEIKKNLERQVTSPVLWYDIINNMKKEGADTFVEIGPGKVIQNLLKKIDPNLRVFGIDKYDDIENFIKII